MNDRDPAEGVEEAGRYLSGEDVVLTDGGEPEEKYTDGGTFEGGGGPAISRRAAIAGAGTIVAAIGIGAYSVTQSGNEAGSGGDSEGGAEYKETTTREKETTTEEKETTSETSTDESGIPDEFQKVASGIGVQGPPPGYLAAREAYTTDEYEGQKYEENWQKGSLMRKILVDRDNTSLKILTEEPFHIWMDGEVYDFENIGIGGDERGDYLESGGDYLISRWEPSSVEGTSDVGGMIYTAFGEDVASEWSKIFPKSSYVFLAKIPDEWVVGVDTDLESEGLDFWGDYEEYIEEFDVKRHPLKQE